MSRAKIGLKVCPGVLWQRNEIKHVLACIWSKVQQNGFVGCSQPKSYALLQCLATVSPDILLLEKGGQLATCNSLPPCPAQAVDLLEAWSLVGVGRVQG